uniref:Uncharacterized protein n=1 Tax=Arundo donax TaxID=35708 RepID=A0A0A9DD09_ARUDO
MKNSSLLMTTRKPKWKHCPGRQQVISIAHNQIKTLICMSPKIVELNLNPSLGDLYQTPELPSSWIGDGWTVSCQLGIQNRAEIIPSFLQFVAFATHLWQVPLLPS